YDDTYLFAENLGNFMAGKLLETIPSQISVYRSQQTFSILSLSAVGRERSFIRSSSMTASYIKLSLDFLTLQGNLACKEADLA
ncbi:hypothetical protein DVA69_19790, partial [Acinetobacter baumannii]